LSLQKIQDVDYDTLLIQCKALVGEAKEHAKRYVKDYWQVGKLLLEVPSKYGDGTMLRLARDLNKNKSELYACREFAEKEPDFGAFEARFSTSRKFEMGLPPWSEIRKGLYEPRKPTSLPTALPINPSATPDELRRAYDPRREPPPTSESKPALMFREILNWLQINHISEKELHVTTEHGPRTYHADFLVGRHILEVDSELHDPDRDEQRDKDLKTLGYDTVRFRDTEIQAAHKLLSCLRQVAAIEEAIPA